MYDSRQLSTEGNWSNLAQFWRSNWIPLSQFRITLRLIVRLFKAFGSKDWLLLHVLSMMPLAFRVTQVKKINKPSVFKKITTKRVFSTVQLLMICDKKTISWLIYLSPVLPELVHFAEVCKSQLCAGWLTSKVTLDHAHASLSFFREILLVEKWILQGVSKKLGFAK